MLRYIYIDWFPANKLQAAAGRCRWDGADQSGFCVRAVISENGLGLTIKELIPRSSSSFDEP